MWRLGRWRPLGRLWLGRWLRSGSAGDLGRLGEKLAARALKRAGMKILARNYRCPSGEVDLIALDRSTRRQSGAETIVFVEVKTRSSDRYTGPEAAVDHDKQRRLENAARYYVARRHAEDFVIRFDIIAIVAPDGQTPKLRHIRDAF